MGYEHACWYRLQAGLVLSMTVTLAEAREHACWYHLQAGLALSMTVTSAEAREHTSQRRPSIASAADLV